ncbi:MAG: HEAT repeat domain-containing protein [Candidatus Cloacimonetes bacterium]|nr:HEAT repeat domain-containing protein [Candidatus Cloacimonadota bacterium]
MIKARIKFIVFAFLYFAFVYFIYHRFLSFPISKMTYWVLGSWLVLLLVPTASIQSVFLGITITLIPWLALFIYLIHTLSGLWLYIGLVFCVSLLVALLHYLYFEEYLLQKELSLGLKSLIDGEYKEQISSSKDSQKNSFIKSLNKLLNKLQEEDFIFQAVSEDHWAENQGEIKRADKRNGETWTLSICVSYKFLENDSIETKLSLQKEFFEEMVEISKISNMGLNRFSNQGCEFLFFKRDEYYEKFAIATFSKLLNSKVSSKLKFFGVVLRDSFLKTGVLFHPEGYQRVGMGAAIRQDFEFLDALKIDGEHFFIHQSFKNVGEQVFWIKDDGQTDSYFEIGGEKDLNHHIENLSSKIVEDKLVSIRMIATQKAVQGLDLLIELLGDVSPRIRVASVKALAQLVTAENEQKIGESFLQCLANEWNHDIRATLVISLGDLKRKELVDPLFELLKDENDRVRANAVEAIGKCMERGTVLRYLNELLQDKNNRARANAAMAIWLMGSPRGFEVLLQMAKDEDELLSCSGLYGLGEIFVNENIEIASRFLGSPVEFYFKNKSLIDQALEVSYSKIFHSHPFVERNSILALKKIRCRKSVAILHEKYLKTNSVDLRQMILESMLEMKEYDLVRTLRGAEA